MNIRGSEKQMVNDKEVRFMSSINKPTRKEGRINWYIISHTNQEIHSYGTPDEYIEYNIYIRSSNPEDKGMKKIPLNDNLIKLANIKGIIRIDDEYFTAYINNAHVYIEPDVRVDEARSFKGLTPSITNELIGFLGWGNYAITLFGYDYDESILTIKKAPNCLEPCYLADNELEYLCEKITGSHIKYVDKINQLEIQVTELQNYIQKLKEKEGY